MDRSADVRPAVVLVAALALSAVASPALAGDDDRWMTGDWNGTRTHLVESGIDLQVDYNAQLAANLSGGFNDDRTMRYVDSGRSAAISTSSACSAGTAPMRASPSAIATAMTSASIASPIRARRCCPRRCRAVTATAMSGA